MTASFSSRVTVSPDVLFREQGDEAILLNLKTGVYFGLDSVATGMWNALQDSESIETAYESLLVRFDVKDWELRRDLSELVDRLLEHGLIEVTEPGQAGK